MAATVVFDLDKVLLGGDASTLFLHGRLRQAPRRLLLLLLAAPLLVPAALLPWLRPLGARLMTRIAIGGDPGSDVEVVAAAYGEALGRTPEAAVADAIACLLEHRRRGDVVVVATGCEETLARGYLAAVGLGEIDVVGSTGVLWPPRVRRAMGESKVEMLVARGYSPPWSAAYSDSRSDLPLFAGTPRPVLVNADEEAADDVEHRLGRRPELRQWR